MSEAAISGERELSGPEKAAALLLMMGKPPAARLLKQFDQPDLRAVALAAASLGAIPATMLDRLVEEFVTDFSAGADLLGDAGQAKSLLGDALPPEQIADILGLASGETGPPDVWRSLGQAPESAIVALLMAERPATATARLIEQAMEAALKKAPTSGADAAGWSRLAGIINSLDPEEADDAMRALEQVRPKEAAIVKTMLFSFNDLPRLSERARALLFDRASIDIVVMALRGTDPDFRDTVLSSMPSRGRRLVEGELNSGAFAPPQDVAKARKAIADIVLGMASRNEIELGAPPSADSP
jgi:flagellar motor switch protein FliG